MQERKITIPDNYTIEDVIYALQRYKNNNDHVWCLYKGRVFRSDEIDEDSLNRYYKEVENYDVDKRLEANKDFQERTMNRRDKISNDDTDRINKVKAAREAAKVNGTVKKIEQSDVINGLKFIAENKDISQDELVDGLIERNCFFTMKDIKNQFKERLFFDEGFRQGKISIGAFIIVNMRDSIVDRPIGMDKFFSDDSDSSIYYYIRNITGDKTYTKEYADSKNKALKKELK